MNILRWIVAWLLLGSSWGAWGIALLTWGLGQGGGGTILGIGGAFALDRVAGPPGGFWVWVALFSWALLSLDRLTAKPPLLLRMGVVCALALLVGRVSMGVLVVPGGWLPVLCGCGAAWMVERE